MSHLPEYKVIMPTKTPNQGLPVYAKNEAGWDLPSHAIQLHAAYPCEILNLHSDSTALQIARNTLYYFSKGIYQYDERIGIECFCDGGPYQI